MVSISEITQILQEKLELKRRCIELETKYIETLARYLKREAEVWTYEFDENEPITEANLNKYLSYSLKESSKYSKEDLLKAVQWLYDDKFDRR